MKTIKRIPRDALFFLGLISLLLISSGVSRVVAWTFKAREMPMVGRWQPAEDPRLIDDYGFQDIQNMRRWGSQYRGVKGHDNVTTAALSDYFNYSQNEWTFYDEASRVSVSGYSITVNNLDSDETAYLVRDVGTEVLSNNFKHYLEFEHTTNFDAIDYYYVWAMSSRSSEYGFTTSGARYVSVRIGYEDATSFIIRLGAKTEPTVAYGTYDYFYTNTTYYLTIEKTLNPRTTAWPPTSSDRTETYYCRIYTDAARTVEATGSPLSLTVNETDIPFRYVYAMSNRNMGLGGRAKDFVIRNHQMVPQPKSAYHYRKTYPGDESHYLLQGSTILYNAIYAYDEAIPYTSTFTSPAIYTETTQSQLDRFAKVPQEYLIYANRDESLIWGGNEFYPLAFITSTSDIGYTVVEGMNYTDRVTNNNQTADNQVSFIGGGNDSHVKLMVHFDGADGSVSFPDSSASAHGVANVYGGSQLDTDQLRFGTASALFDSATSDHIGYTDSADWNFAGGDFTVDCWVMFYDLTSDKGIWGQYVDDNNRYGLYYDSTLKAIEFEEYTGATQRVSAGGLWSPKIYTWYHIAVERDGNSWRVYADGMQIGGTVTDSSNIDDLAGEFEIGRGLAAGRFMNGWIDEVRVTKGVARYKGDFTPPDKGYIASALYWLVGSPMRLTGTKYYTLQANSEPATLSVWNWTGGAWTALSMPDTSYTDATSGLQADGWVTWPDNTEAQKRYIEGLSLYWYKFQLSNGETSVYKVTCTGPFQEVPNIWDGGSTVVADFRVYSPTEAVKDFTDEVNDDTTEFYADISCLPSAGYVLIGFTEPQQGIYPRVLAGSENTTTANLTVYFWNGNEFEELRALADGTSYTTPTPISIVQSGAIAWQPTDIGTEFEKQLDESAPLYWYKLQWDATLDSDTKIYHVTGIPAPQPIDQDHRFPAEFQGRAFLFKENRAIYSAYNAPYIWSGYDAGNIRNIGTSDVIAAGRIYNLFNTTGYDQLIICTKDGTFRLFGDGPANWQLQQISGTIGCVAPLSMAVCDLTDLSQGENRHVLAWVSARGVELCDGAKIVPISHDVRCYWDSTDSRYIPTDRQDDTVCWFDSNLQALKCLISSGTGQTTHNVELEYSFRYREWTKLYRENASGANPLQTGTQVQDVNGILYSYGFAPDGYLYRLEYGKTWNGTAIAQYLHTKDIMMDTEFPFWKHTTLRYFRALNKAKAGGENISVAHYCDGVISAAGSNTRPISAWSMASAYTTQSVLLGPCMWHSFKVSSDVSAVDDGMEIVGLGVLYDSMDRVLQ